MVGATSNEGFLVAVLQQSNFSQVDISLYDTLNRTVQSIDIGSNLELDYSNPFNAFALSGRTHVCSPEGQKLYLYVGLLHVDVILYRKLLTTV